MRKDARKLLSICIPTYNRDWCLKDLTKVLKEQISAGLEDYVEVIFSDNCSDDETQNLLRKFELENSYVKYYRNEKNIGFGRNFLKSASYASGEFTWILGDDDLPADGAVRELINVIKKRNNDDIILFNFTQKDVLMKKTIKNFYALLNEDDEYYLSDDNELFKYLNNAEYSSILFSYISCYIFRTLNFSADNVKEKYKDHPFTQMFYIWGSRDKRLNIFYLNKLLLLNRSGNDRISDNVYDVINVFLSGILDLCDEYFADKPVLYNAVINISKKFDGACREKFILKSVKYLDKNNFKSLINKLIRLNYPKKFILFIYLKKFYYFFRKR